MTANAQAVWAAVEKACGKAMLRGPQYAPAPLLEAKTKLISEFAADKPLAEWSIAEAEDFGRRVQERYAESVPSDIREWHNVRFIAMYQVGGVVVIRYVGDLPESIAGDSASMLALALCGSS